MGLESTFNTNAVRDFAHGEGGTEATVADADDDTFVGLQTLTLAFLDTHLYDHGVAGAEIRHVLLQLSLFNQLNDFVSAAHG